MFCQCPDCGNAHHVKIDAVAPGTRPGDVPKIPCFTCWKAARAKAQAAWDLLAEEHRALAVRLVTGDITVEETARLTEVRAGMDAAETALCAS